MFPLKKTFLQVSSCCPLTLMWRNFVCLMETCLCYRNLFLVQKLVSMKETFCVTETCFCDGNLFLVTETFFLQIFFVCVNLVFCEKTKKKKINMTETFLCDRNLYQWKKFTSLTEPQTVTFSCDRTFFFCQYWPFWGILYIISREKFPWEMGVSVILDTRDTHFGEPF